MVDKTSRRVNDTLKDIFLTTIKQRDYSDMSETQLKCPSRGRLFKLFTDIGPYFRKLKSDENTFFFDCLEICVDAEQEPEERIFLGWWLLLTLTENGFEYERFNGLYDMQSNWVATEISAAQMQQINQSFNIFIAKLEKMLEAETSYQLKQIS